MAYVFNKTLNSLGAQDQNKTDIFGGQGLVGNEAQGAGATQTAPDVKQSVEGALTPSKASSVSATPGVKDVKSPQTAVVARNIGKQQAPQALGQASQDISQASQALEQEAQSYLDRPTTQRQTYTTQDVSRASQEGGDEWNRIMGALNAGPAQVEAFKPETDTNIESASKLATDAGVREVMREEAGPQYTSGMGHFDQMLLNQNPGARAELQAVQRGQNELAHRARALGGTEGEAATMRQQQEQDALEGYQRGLRGAMGMASSQIQNQAAQEAADYRRMQDYMRGNTAGVSAEDAARYEQQKNDIINQGMKQAYQQARGQLSDAEQEYLKQGMRNVDANQFLQFNPMAASQFIDQDEAGQYNRIMAALGKGDTLQAGAEVDPVNFALDPYVQNLVSQAKFGYGRTQMPGYIAPPEPGAMPELDMGVVNKVVDPLSRGYIGRSLGRATERAGKSIAVEGRRGAEEAGKPISPPDSRRTDEKIVDIANSDLGKQATKPTQTQSPFQKVMSALGVL